MNDNTLYDDLLLATAALLEEHEYKRKIAEKEKEREEEEERLAEADEKLEITKIAPTKAFTVLATILMALSILWLIIGLAFLSSDPEISEIFIAFFLICIALSITFIITNRSKKESYKFDIEEATEEHKKCKAVVAKHIKKIDLEIANLRQALDDKHFECLKLTEEIPVAYSDLFSVSYMLMLVTNQRCDTLKEAINMLELERRHHQLLSALQVIGTKLGYINSALSQVKACLSNLNTNVIKMKAIETLEFLES